MDKAEFWATKSPLAQYHAIVFDHAEFATPFRIVANQFDTVTLDGNAHLPVPMQIKAPDVGIDSTAPLTMAFPRQVVGRQFKAALALVAAAGSRDPVQVTYSVYLGVTSSPQITIVRYISDRAGVQFRGDVVQVQATVDNPMRRAPGLIYDPATFTGLELI